jgi:hypothetical protein
VPVQPWGSGLCAGRVLAGDRIMSRIDTSEIN